MIKSVEMKLSYGEVGKRRFVFSSKWEEEYRGGRSRWDLFCPKLKIKAAGSESVDSCFFLFLVSPC